MTPFGVSPLRVEHSICPCMTLCSSVPSEVKAFLTTQNNGGHRRNLVNWHSSGIALRIKRGRNGAASSGHFSIEVEIGGSQASNKSRSATEGQILNCPLNENQDPALKLHDVSKVDEGPNQPPCLHRGV